MYFKPVKTSGNYIGDLACCFFKKLNKWSITPNAIKGLPKKWVESRKK